VLDRRLDQRHQLRLVAGEAARDVRSAELQGERDEIDRGIGIDGARRAFGWPRSAPSSVRRRHHR